MSNVHWFEECCIVQIINTYNFKRYSGKKSWDPVRSMHDTRAGRQNPYQRVIGVIGRTLEVFDDDKLIPCFGFGDSLTKGQRCFPFWPDGRSAYGFQEALERYGEIASNIVLSGPTNFAPVINEAVQICKKTREYHILVIVCDGQVTSVAETRAAIVEAVGFIVIAVPPPFFFACKGNPHSNDRLLFIQAKVALSIVIIGVGDGPWDEMHVLDDGLDERRIDNVQFVDSTKHNNDASFALAALMEIPPQFKAYKLAGYL